MSCRTDLPRRWRFVVGRGNRRPLDWGQTRQKIGLAGFLGLCALTAVVLVSTRVLYRASVTSSISAVRWVYRALFERAFRYEPAPHSNHIQEGSELSGHRRMATVPQRLGGHLVYLQVAGFEDMPPVFNRGCGKLTL